MIAIEQKGKYRKESWVTAEPPTNGEQQQEEEKQPVTKGKKKFKQNARGANRGQRGKKHIVDTVRICKHLAAGDECPFGKDCRQSHDLRAYLETKPKDIGDSCVHFNLFGRCYYGYKCRYLSAHIDQDGKLIENKEAVDPPSSFTTNGICSETQKALHQGKWKFPKTDEYMKVVAVEIEEEQNAKDANTLKKREMEDREDMAMKRARIESESDSENDEFFDAPSEFTNVEIEPAEETKMGPIDTGYRKLIDFRNKTYLAPLTTVGNLPFRRICKEYGVDITCGEMALSANLLRGQQSEWALTKRHKSEDIFGIQICGSKVEQVTRAAEVLNEEVDVDFIDLNMGCPIDLVFKQTVTDIPITAKFRIGVKDNVPIAHRIIPKLDELLHGRSRAQRYTKKADWEYIGKMKNLTNNMPLFGNGDIMSFEDYNFDTSLSGVDGVMIGRGALIKPWIFDEIKNQRHWDISSNERFDMLKRFRDYGLEHWGSDSQGVNTTRRFLCEWQSFLYRYIPLGLLEHPPQHMNERPPPFQGRNDLETLMASPVSADWVKLSEMLLGPAPDDFKFIPKHKANSFENIEKEIAVKDTKHYLDEPYVHPYPICDIESNLIKFFLH
ncbi:FMN-linked oxidoreductase [Backusella circina FSU 941]|nr:FMN-linked oxidoreductase [Backusella circina FSU 941]